ncbi:MAG: hypothetical protein HN778_08540 [Prolixibacteraceae bacterium]|jgi:hypothetical protein|nr:hypothetical protein [Prolixibacteraceae bacterium]MBT6006983.1 hypothetical protein [Prolixibacteraceae bacterium]MBT6765892.1 hypothetical protein [Prolixibacteraceae bacterium]MBT7000762.1 hypothetical protein [Prolixibacteraceae bacterium]MBT7394862.1 hypothetical protein [Prolixibacteraceae bacterium]
MRNDYMEALVWLGFFAAVFLAWYFYLKARNKERMALIESGKDVSEIYSKQEIKFKFPWLKLGIILTGSSFGLLVSMFFLGTNFENFQNLNSVSEGPFVLGITLFFAAISIIIAYFADKPKN